MWSFAIAVAQAVIETGSTTPSTSRDEFSIVRLGISLLILLLLTRYIRRRRNRSSSLDEK